MVQKAPAEKLIESWNIFATGKIEEAYQLISSASIYGESPNITLMTLRSAHFLFSHDYPELKDIGEKSKREFAKIVAWNYLLDSTISKDRIWWFKKAFLAPFLGKKYSLDINIKELNDAIGILLLWDNNQYELNRMIINGIKHQTWSELEELQNLSINTRSFFINIIRYAQVRFGGLADIKRITHTDLAGSQQSLLELSNIKLIETSPSANDLLMSKRLIDLKHYAAKNGIAYSGTKNQLISQIIAGIDNFLVYEWLSEENQKKYIKINVNNFPLLKKHILTESALLESYGHWIYQTKFLNKSNEVLRIERHNKLNSNPYMPMEPWTPWLKNKKLIRGLDSPRMESLKKIWDNDCDDILKDTIAKSAWNWEMNIEKTLQKYLSAEKMQAIENTCGDTLSLRRECELRAIELDLKIRQPKLLLCKGCGIQFMDWSLSPKYSELVDYKIHFCQSCYITALGRFNYGFGKPIVEIENKEKALNQIFQVANILKIIPDAHFLRNRSFAEISDGDQILLINTLLDMPPFREYIKAFGSWLNVLISSNILANGTRRTSRGIQCIALDGHVCLSLPEKEIDDWFTKNKINHNKEWIYPYHPRLNTSGMRADWKVGDTLIEYAGLMEEPHYESKIETKLELCREYNLNILILYPKDILDLNKKLDGLFKTK